uniref:Uncharacterized protein n=1 Tax=Anguilla anguilla TaxID=7936 RepID=A0A0E9QMG3_ANGAN
MLRPLFLLFL